MKRALGVGITLIAASYGCTSPAAGGHPTDGGGDGALDQSGKLMHTDASCPADAMGGGVCPINFCGQLYPASALPSDQYPTSGADSICNDGRVCVVGAVLATGNGFQLTCAAPVPGALGFGAGCSPNPADGRRCLSDSLCIAGPDSARDFFCSTLCRNDADCPATARCLEYPTAALPNGAAAMVGECTPESKIGGHACAREADCPAGEGCVAVGTRTSLDVCEAAPGTKPVGQRCAASSECRSAACYDRDLRLSGGANRTYCSAPCAVSSDCGPDQRCARVVVNNDGTPSYPLDDVVEGLCQTLFSPVTGGACAADGDCTALGNGSDACDTTHGLCYRREAVPGSACTTDTGCPLGGICSMATPFRGGYCQIYGCDPKATAGPDLCPGPSSVCAERGPDSPLHACYEACTVGGPGCSRASEGYACAALTTGGPGVCLENGGT